MKVHETNDETKRKHDEMEEEDAEVVKKYLIKCNNEYEKKITLGKTVSWTRCMFRACFA